MMSLIPLPWKLAGLALLIAVCSVSGYVLGRKHVRQAWDADRAAVTAEMSRLKGKQEERERMWTEAMKVAGEKWNARTEKADRDFDSYLSRLRDAYARSDRVRSASTPAQACPADSIGTKAELLREAEALVGAIRDADRDRAGLEAAVSAWPR